MKHMKFFRGKGDHNVLELEQMVIQRGELITQLSSKLTELSDRNDSLAMANDYATEQLNVMTMDHAELKMKYQKLKGSTYL